MYEIEDFLGKMCSTEGQIQHIMKEKDTKVIMSNDELDKIKSCINEADIQLEKLSSTFMLMEQRSRQNTADKIYKNISYILRRIDIKSGINLLKILLWVAMAWVIVKFSNDMNAKIVSSLTFFMGLVIDMLLLRKQLPQSGYTIFRLIVGVCSLAFGGIIVLLIANLISVSMGGEVYAYLESFIDRAVYVCGVFSTFLEFINSVAIDD